MDVILSDKEVSSVGESLYFNDNIFKEIISKLTPLQINLYNNEFLSSFGDILATLSIPSMNITDVFYKEKNRLDPVNYNQNSKYLRNIQDTINQTFMQDFWATNNNYYKNYLVNNELEDIIYRYSLLEEIPKDLDLELYKNFNQLFTEDKYLGWHDFKIKKGTKTSLEYAFKSVWNAKIEGILQEDYYFSFRDELYLDPLYDGSCINPLDASFVPDPHYNPFPYWYENPYSYPPQTDFCDDPINCNCTETSHRIGTWIISPTPSSNRISKKEPFKYWVEGSLLPIFYDTVVKDLAHPVGFEYDYKRIFKSSWDDYFNLDNIISSNSVKIKTLCYEGDCSQFVVEIFSSKNGEKSITGSDLKNIEIYKEYYNNNVYDIREYIFKNGHILKEYNNENNNLIEYYNNNFDELENLLHNGNFDGYGYWSYGDRWQININKEKIILNSTGIDDTLSQNINLLENKYYIIEIDVTEINGEIKITIGSKKIEINKSGKYYFKFYNYLAQNTDILIEDSKGFSTCKIDFIKICENIPTKIYPNHWHSSIIVEGLKTLRPILTTRDEFLTNLKFGDQIIDPNSGDYLNDLPLNLPKYPFIGAGLTISQNSGDINNAYSFKIGCYDPEDGPYPPYLDDNDCCTPNIPYNPPSWNPGDPCILSEIIVNNEYLKYIRDNIEIEVNTINKYPVTIDKGFESWNIISGNATIIDGVLSQDGTEESIVEKEIDYCIYNYDIFGFIFTSEFILSPEINITFEYIDSDGNIIYNNPINCLDLPNLEFMVKNAVCNKITRPKPKVRIILPIGFELKLKNASLYKY
jgi:hypothetical protein